MTASGRRSARSGRPEANWSAPGLILVLFAVALLGLTGCQTGGSIRQAAPAEVNDAVRFNIRDASLEPLPGVRIDLLIESGRLDRLEPVITDARGAAAINLQAAALPRLPGLHPSDKLFTFQTALIYRTDLPGYLPVRGRVLLTDAYDSFKRPEFAELMNRRPGDKHRLVELNLIRINDLIAPGSAENPAMAMITAGLDRLWLAWQINDRATAVRFHRRSIGPETTPNGLYLKVGLELIQPIGDASDNSVHSVFSAHLLPIIEDLAAVYGQVVDGYDLTMFMPISQKGDPHALTDSHRLRLVFSEAQRYFWAHSQVGLNQLILSAEQCRLDESPWTPLANVDRSDAKLAFSWDMAGLFYTPGPGEIPESKKIEATVEDVMREVVGNPGLE